MIFGPAISVLNAFLFIGFNITARDKLHDAWHGKHLKRNMLLLILAGSIISFLFGAGRIAIASFIAFAVSESADAIIYHLLRDKVKLLQVNGSNVVSAGLDSILFPLLAFGWPPLWGVMLGQFLAKVFGGAIWSVILNHRRFRGYDASTGL
jgi:queuosine precursor transporter